MRSGGTVMIRLEEYDLAQFSLTEGYVAVPFEVYQPVDGELIVTTI